ncbi:hypothetical protein EBT31_18625, partial [bacterium]|nr:hypothetical protein [bacterium]
MGAVLQYLADELMRDAFPYDYSGSVEIFIDALKLKQRLLEAVNSHPETKTDTGSLQQFVITTAYAGGAGNLAISPSIVTSGARQNVSAS